MCAVIRSKPELKRLKKIVFLLIVDTSMSEESNIVISQASEDSFWFFAVCASDVVLAVVNFPTKSSALSGSILSVDH